MSRVYATRDDTGERVLVEIQCDRSECRAAIKPNQDIAASGWTKRGERVGASVGDSIEWDFCPEHWQ